MARTCEYTFGDTTLRGIPAFKAYLVEGGLEKLFPGRSFPLNPVARATRGAIQPTLDIFANRAEAQAALSERFGSGVDRLADSGVLNFTQGKESWPQIVQNQLRGDEEAVYLNGKAYIDLQATSKDRLPAVLLHEVGEHFNLRQMIGTKAYLNLQSQISILAKRPDSEANRVWQEVKNNYEHLDEGSELFISEVIAKLGERNTQAPWYKRLIAQIKSFMMTRGLARSFVAGTIQDHEVHALLVGSLKSAATGRRMNSPSFYGETVQASFAGEKAKTAKLDARAIAEQRLAAGEDAETVRKETGWHRGADMEMRFEIDDSKAIPAEIGNTFNDVFEKAYLNNLGEKVTVGDVLIHPELYSAYPELAKIEVQELPEGTENAGRVIHKKGQPPVIQLSGSLTKNRWLLTLLHELQHGIQNIEGFAKGGESAKYADKNEYRRLYGEMEARNVMLRKGLTGKERIETSPLSTQDIADEEAVVQFSRPPETTKQWNEWFGGSKMVKANGDPLVFFRGDQSEVNRLDKAKLGVNTGHPATGLGFFFTQDKQEALGYGPNVKEVFLSITKPFVMNWNDRLDYFHNPAEAKRFAEKLKAEGYDGISIPDIKQAVIFDSNQAKLTSNEKPKASTGDMRFSRPDKYFRGDTEQNKELFGQGIKVIKNPTRAKAFRVAGESQYEEIRGVVDHSTGNLYISDAGKTLHEHIIEVAKLPEDRESRTMYELIKIPKDAIYDYRGNIFSDDTAAQFSRPTKDNLYSALTRAVEKAPEKAFGDAQQIKLWINANAAKFDVKRDEIYWSGLNDWLDLQIGKVSRDDILKFMDANGVKVEDAVLARIGAKHGNASLTLPGGTDYRELVVTIPTTEKFNEHDVTHFGDVGKGKQVAWIRHNTRTDADGNKVLFLEEVQSQRGAEGRTKGFSVKGKTPSFSDLKAIPAKRATVGMIPEWYVLPKDTPDDAGAFVGKKVFGESEEDAIERAIEIFELQPAKENDQGVKYVLVKSTGVPSAPFVTDANNKATNAYISLLMKKAIGEAIDSGHTSVAWTTGDQQADRYDLSKQIESITYYKDGSMYYRTVDGDGNDLGTVPEDKIQDYIGKDAAKKLLEQAPDNRGNRSLEGEDIKTSPQWTQAMYGDDKGLNTRGKPSLILQAANDIARKFGGEIGSVELPTGTQPALIITDKMREKILGEGMPMFSRPATATDDSEWKSWSDNVRAKLQNTTDKLFGERLAFLSVRQIVEVAKDYLPGISAYEDTMQARRAIIDTELRNAEQIVTPWRKLPKPIIRRLNRLVQNSTLSDVDASRSWTGVEWTPYGYQAYTQAKLNANNQGRLKLAAEEAGAEAITKSSATFKNQEDAGRFMDLIHKLESEQGAYRANNGYADENIDRRAKHIDLYKEHGALPENARKVYSEANKLHMNLFNQRMDALIARVSEAVLDANKRKEMIAALRLQFESNSLSWYYAPLARHGNHWFFGTDKDGKKWFRTFEAAVGRDQAVEHFKAAGGKIDGSGTSIKDMVNLRMDGSSDAFVLQVKELIDKSLPADVAADLQDEVYQMYLATLPDVSVRHSAMHRKGTLGFDEDAMRSFSGAIHHGASQLANMKYGRKMEQVLRDHKKAIDMANSGYQLAKAKREIEAARMLVANLDTLTTPGVLENKLADVGDNTEREQLLQEAIALRDKFKNGDTEESLFNFIKKQKELIALAKDITPENSRKASDVVSELLQSYNAMVNTNSTAMDQVAGYVRQFGFMWMLGFGLSSGMVNMLQTPIVAMPVIAGKFGLAKTMSGFNQAYSLMVKAIANKNTDEDGNKSISVELQKMLDAKGISQTLRDRLSDAVEAMTIFKEEGDISRTQTFDVIGVGREGEEYGGKLQDFSKKAGWMFHHGERVNREVTLYASYNLARDSGMNHDDAIAYARYANNRAHGDYSSENAARIFRGWPAGVALQFKKYPQMMLFLWGKTMVDWLNGWRKMPDGPAKEAAKLKSQEAGRTFAGLLIMQGAVAGAFGLPLMGAMQVLMDAIGGAVSDPDDPWDTEREVRTWLTEVGGETFATAMVKGALNAATPANFSDRLDLANLFFREPMKELEGRDAATNYISQVAGPFGGLIQKLAEGGKLIMDGELLRGVEMASPKAIGDILKAGRFMSEDARSLNSAKLKDMEPKEIALQLMGMGSSKLEVAYAERGYVKAAEAARNEAHRKIVNTAARTIQEGKPYPEAEIKAWNEKHPEWRITRDTVQKSLNAIKQNEKRRGIRGYSVNPKMEDLYEKYNLRDDEE